MAFCQIRSTFSALLNSVLSPITASWISCS